MADTRNGKAKASPARASDPAEGTDTFTSGVSKTLAKRGRGFHANGSGTVQITMPDGTTPTFTVNSGQFYPYEVVGIVAGGTNVSGYVLL